MSWGRNEYNIELLSAIAAKNKEKKSSQGLHLWLSWVTLPTAGLVPDNSWVRKHVIQRSA